MNYNITSKEFDLIRIAKENFREEFANNLVEKVMTDITRAGLPVNDDDELVSKSFDLVTSQLSGMVKEINKNSKASESSYYGTLRTIVDKYTDKEANQRSLYIQECLKQDPTIRHNDKDVKFNKFVTSSFESMSFTVEEFLSGYEDERKFLLSNEEQAIIDEIKSKVVSSISETEQKNEMYSTIIDETEAVKKEYGDSETFGEPKKEEDETAAAEPTTEEPTTDGGEEPTEEEGGEEPATEEPTEETNESLRLNRAYEDYTDVENNPVTYDPRGVESLINEATQSVEDQKKDYLKALESVLENEKDQINQMTNDSSLNEEEGQKRSLTVTDDDIVNSTETDEDVVNDTTEAYSGYGYLVEKIAPRTSLKFLDTKVYSPESLASFLIKHGSIRSPKDNSMTVLEGVKRNLESLKPALYDEVNSNLLLVKHKRLTENYEKAKNIMLKYGVINSELGLRSDGTIMESSDVITLAIVKNILNRNYISDESMRKGSVVSALKIEGDERVIALENIVDMKFDINRKKSLLYRSNNIEQGRENVSILEGDLLSILDNMDPLVDTKKLDSIDKLLSDAQYKRYMDTQSLYLNYTKLLETSRESKITLSDAISSGGFKKQVMDRLVTKFGAETVESRKLEIEKMIDDGIGFTSKNSFEKLLLKNINHIKSEKGGHNLTSEDRDIALNRSKAMLTLFETIESTGAMTLSIQNQFNDYINS